MNLWILYVVCRSLSWLYFGPFETSTSTKTLGERKMKKIGIVIHCCAVLLVYSWRLSEMACSKDFAEIEIAP